MSRPLSADVDSVDLSRLAVSSLFDSWFGYILWGACWFQLYYRKPKHERTTMDYVEYAINVVMVIVGLFFFGAGTYAAAQSIKNSYAIGAISESRHRQPAGDDRC